MQASEYFCVGMRCEEFFQDITRARICPDECELSGYYAARGIAPPLRKQGRIFLAGLHGS